MTGWSPRWLASAYRGEQQIDFPRLWRRALIGSLAAVVVSLASFAVLGVDLGIEFEGGTSWEVPAPTVSVAEVRDALRGTGAADAKIQTLGGDTIRVRADVEGAEAVDGVRNALAEMAGVTGDDVSVTTVGPSWGSEITGQARTALIAFFAIIAAYIAVRLEWRMAVGALLAVAHDIVVSVGFYSLFQFEITPATVIAFLTIMGYSLYDTIVVYDKVREVVGRVSATGRYTYTEMMNLSLNQVLMRSINTSITSMIPVVSMLVIGSFVLGAVTLQEFAIRPAGGHLGGHLLFAVRSSPSGGQDEGTRARLRRDRRADPPARRRGGRRGHPHRRGRRRGAGRGGRSQTIGRSPSGRIGSPACGRIGARRHPPASSQEEEAVNAVARGRGVPV